MFVTVVLGVSTPRRPKILFGTEVEYAASGVNAQGGYLSPSLVARMLLRQAQRRPHLEGTQGGIFLPTGGRCLIDAAGRASHFEVCSPETVDPFDAVRYELAGDRLVTQLAQEIVSIDAAVDAIWVQKRGVDYVERATWGAHENYLFCLTPPEQLYPQLVSHCVTRIIFTGAGGFDDDGWFVLSPRATFIGRVVDASSNDARALVDTRHEPHSVGHQRLHLMCGDHLRGQLGIVLKIGTTALIVALADAGCLEADAVQLAEPLDALDVVNHDVTLREPLALTNGRTARALDVQRYLLGQARTWKHLLPDWTDAICDLWSDALDGLNQGPMAIADRLEWCLKLMLFERRVSDHSIRRSDHDVRGVESCPVDDHRMAQLHELDLRFAQLHPPGLFEELELTPAGGRALFRHHVSGIGDVDQALNTPPSQSRAAIRGAVVQRLAGHSPPFACTWDSVRHAPGRLRLDLSDPFAAAENWVYDNGEHRDMPREVWELVIQVDHPDSLPMPARVRELAEPFCHPDAADLRRRSGPYAVDINNQALDFRDRGKLDEAEWLLRAALAIDVECAGPWRKVPHRRNNLAALLVMRGRLDEARQQLTMAWQSIGREYDLTSARVLTMRLMTAFLADEPHDLYLGQLKQHLRIKPLPDLANVTAHWQADNILRMVTPTLTAEQSGLLRDVIAVLNRQRASETLDRWPSWQAAEACELDLPWPASTPQAGMTEMKGAACDS